MGKRDKQDVLKEERDALLVNPRGENSLVLMHKKGDQMASSRFWVHKTVLPRLARTKMPVRHGTYPKSNLFHSTTD